jgi:hypothetical protein
VELLAIHVPGDGLGGPAARGAVPDEAPDLPVLAGDADALAEAVGLVADAAGVDWRLSVVAWFKKRGRDRVGVIQEYVEGD